MVREDVNPAIQTGVPFNRIKGMNQYLQETISKYSELTYLVVTDSAGDILYHGGESDRVSLPLTASKSPETVLQASVVSRRAGRPGSDAPPAGRRMDLARRLDLFPPIQLLRFAELINTDS